MARNADKYVPAMEQSKHSAQAVNRALYYLRSKAKDLRDGRNTMCRFQGQYDTVENMNFPIHCKKTGEKMDRNRKMQPVFECFKYPPKKGGRREGLVLERQRASFSGAHFDGVHCRDGQGVFVPVSQCRRSGRKRKR